MKKLETNNVETPAGLSQEAVTEISGGLRQLLADVFVLYLKTKNFHWHMTGPHFRDYHLLLDEQASQIFAMTDEIAELGKGYLSMFSRGGAIHRLTTLA